MDSPAAKEIRVCKKTEDEGVDIQESAIEETY